ncbi:hypothetical protein D3C78_1801510 [compost metagenome]
MIEEGVLVVVENSGMSRVAGEAQLITDHVLMSGEDRLDQYDVIQLPWMDRDLSPKGHSGNPRIAS